MRMSPKALHSYFIENRTILVVFAFCEWTHVKQGNALAVSCNITGWKCKHTERWYSQREAARFWELGQQLSVWPHSTEIWHVEHDFPTLWDGTSTTREQNPPSSLYQWSCSCRAPCLWQAGDSGESNSLDEPDLSPTHSPSPSSSPQQQFLPVLCVLILSLSNASPRICR